ncbi:MAG: dephospho-CoA kinase [Pirellulaceae bacterium]
MYLSNVIDLAEPPVILGVTGGIGSGKSAVSDLLVQRGAALFDADIAGHEVLSYEEAKAALTARWGAVVVGNDGNLCRSTIGEIVFSDPGELRFLESVSHPVIHRMLLQSITDARATRCLTALVIDAALLLEKTWNESCDLVVFVDCEEDMRWQRCESRNWSREQFLAREAAQLPVESKQERCDVVIDNTGSLEELSDQVNNFWNVLEQLHT